MAPETPRTSSDTLVRGPGALALWTGVLAGPLVLALEQTLNFALVHWACLNGAQWVLRLIDFLALLFTGLAALLAWQCWTRVGRANPEETGGTRGSVRFMALGGVLLSVMFFLALLAHGISTFLIGACQ